MSTGETVAVKVLSANSKQGEKEFRNEVILHERLRKLSELEFIILFQIIDVEGFLCSISKLQIINVKGLYHLNYPSLAASMKAIEMWLFHFNS